MRFNTDLDAQTFLIEIKAFKKLNEASKDYVPTANEMKLFLKARTPLVKKLKNHRKSADMKSHWRENRGKMMKGIKAFHKSVEGKRFHKRLGRFLATRVLRPKQESIDESYQMLLMKQAYLKGINSAKQHLLVELDYFHQLQEQLELEEFITDYAFPLFKTIEEKVLSEDALTDNEKIFLFDLIEENSLIKSISEKAGQTFAQIEKLWNAISIDLKEKGVEKSNDNFFPQLSDKLRDSLGTK